MAPPAGVPAAVVAEGEAGRVGDAAAVVAVAVAGAAVAVEAAVGVAVAAAVVAVAVAAAVVFVAVGLAAWPCTTTRPVMLGWMLQWYGKLPAAVNVCEKLVPVDMLPESNTPGVSELAVCGTPASLFVQVTVSPTFTVTVPGAKAKPLIDTLWFAARTSRVKRSAPPTRASAARIPAGKARRATETFICPTSRDESSRGLYAMQLVWDSPGG